MSEKALPFHSFIDCLSWLYQRIQNGCIHYPGYFTFHSMNFATTEKEKGKRVMEHYCQHIKYSMLDILNQDPCVRKNAFDVAFTKDFSSTWCLTYYYRCYYSIKQIVSPCLQWFSEPFTKF